MRTGRRWQKMPDRAAIEEVRRLKADPHKKTYGSFKEIMEELPDE